MRVISILVAIIVAFSLYFLIVDRNSLINFISKFHNEEKIGTNSKINNKRQLDRLIKKLYNINHVDKVERIGK